ncbi:MAG: D-glycero-alpha-D-manno-heptose-1,7-bisphosphate 7-phosphatase [Candidatus Limnocylindrales bacterium]
MNTTRRGVFLDRDGVLNAAVVRDGRPFPPDGPEHTVRLPRVEDACSRLAAAGLVLVVVTNQPDVARGACTLADVEAINSAVTRGLPITDVLVCPHDDTDDCRCRKPRPGMLLEAAERWGLDLWASVMVGDRWRDIEAGHRAGTRTIFVDHGYAEELPVASDYVVSSLSEAADLILAAGAAS